MSHKNAKKYRRFMKNLLNTFNPIADQALEQVRGDFEIYNKWLSAAAGAHLLSPQTPLEDLLPNQLDQTLAQLRKEFLPQLDA